MRHCDRSGRRQCLVWDARPSDWKALTAAGAPPLASLAGGDAVRCFCTCRYILTGSLVFYLVSTSNNFTWLSHYTGSSKVRFAASEDIINNVSRISFDASIFVYSPCDRRLSGYRSLFSRTSRKSWTLHDWRTLTGGSIVFQYVLFSRILHSQRYT